MPPEESNHPGRLLILGNPDEHCGIEQAQAGDNCYSGGCPEQAGAIAGVGERLTTSGVGGVDLPPKDLIQIAQQVSRQVELERGVAPNRDRDRIGVEIDHDPDRQQQGVPQGPLADYQEFPEKGLERLRCGDPL
jgi:hypothetical protein